ncbi:MAG: hypothetical protein AABX16_00175 [Nanoarchaeota archaeon]
MPKIIKMVKKFIITLFIIALVLQLSLILAADTTIKIKTLPDHRVSLIVREAGKLTSLESFHKDTSTGELTITSTVSVASIDLLVTLKKDTANIINRKYEGIATGQELFLDFIPGEDKIKTAAEIAEEEAKKAAEETVKEDEINQKTKEADTKLATETATEPASESIKEQTAENTDKKTTETSEESSTGLTSLAISGIKENFSIIGAVIIGLIVVVVVILTFNSSLVRGKIENFKIKPLSQLREEQKKTASHTRIEEIEGKLKSLQNELSDIKNKETRLHELKERMKKDQEEFKKLAGSGFSF